MILILKVEGPTLSGEAKELDAKVTAAGEKVRALKAAKADKAEVDEAVKVLLGLKADFKAAAGFDWKPAGAADPKKGKGKEEKENKQPKKEAPADGEKSETQKKRDAKKAEKLAKKAAHKSEEAAAAGGGEDEGKDEGPDVSEGKYGVQEMNMSKERLTTVVTHVKELGLKLNGKTVTVRGRLHTSRAKGKQCFIVLRQQAASVQCLIYVSENVSKQMVKFAAHISKESIIDVEAVVTKVEEKIESCSQQDVELHVKQVNFCSDCLETLEA